MPSTLVGLYGQAVCFTKPDTSIVVFSDVDRVLRAPHSAAFTRAAAVLKQLAVDNTALVLCSGKTRAEIAFVQQKLDIAHPFICEHGGAVVFPACYFDIEIAHSHNLAGDQIVEFGRPYSEVIDILHHTARRLRLEVVGFSDMSIEQVAQECRLSLLEARLAKRREYDEPFRLLDSGPSSRSRLFNALDARSLRGRKGTPFDHVGAPVDSSLGVHLLTNLYRRARGSVRTVAVTHGLPHSMLARLVDDVIKVAADDIGRESIDIADWADAIVDHVHQRREGDRRSVPGCQ